MRTTTTPGRTWPFLFSALLMVAVPILAADAHQPPMALLAADASGRVLLAVPVTTGERFSIVFTHSLALSRVEEIFEITSAEEFRLRETTYEDFGAGLPHEETPEQHMEFKDGRIRRSGYDMPFRELTLRVGHIADHHLIVGAAAPIRLADIERPGGEIRLRLENIPATPKKESRPAAEAAAR